MSGWFAVSPAIAIVVGRFAARLATRGRGCSGLPALAAVPFDNALGVGKSSFYISDCAELSVWRTSAYLTDGQPTSIDELDRISGGGYVKGICNGDNRSADHVLFDVEPLYEFRQKASDTRGAQR
ncbi:hypothetical protein [Acidithiobacillus sp.]|uniref:hypothetical protein n=1 Tax=Acidithiobacillus sp. TaxID=1872118 RepID=UPI003D05BF0C